MHGDKDAFKWAQLTSLTRVIVYTRIFLYKYYLFLRIVSQLTLFFYFIIVKKKKKKSGNKGIKYNMYT